MLFRSDKRIEMQYSLTATTGIVYKKGLVSGDYLDPIRIDYTILVVILLGIS